MYISARDKFDLIESAINIYREQEYCSAEEYAAMLTWLYVLEDRYERGN